MHGDGVHRVKWNAVVCVCWFVLVLQGSLLRGMSLKIKRKMKSAATMLELAGMS